MYSQPPTEMLFPYNDPQKIRNISEYSFSNSYAQIFLFGRIYIFLNKWMTFSWHTNFVTLNGSSSAEITPRISFAFPRALEIAFNFMLYINTIFNCKQKTMHFWHRVTDMQLQKGLEVRSAKIERPFISHKILMNAKMAACQFFLGVLLFHANEVVFRLILSLSTIAFLKFFCSHPFLTESNKSILIHQGHDVKDHRSSAQATNRSKRIGYGR